MFTIFQYDNSLLKALYELKIPLTQTSVYQSDVYVNAEQEKLELLKKQFSGSRYFVPNEDAPGSWIHRLALEIPFHYMPDKQVERHLLKGGYRFTLNKELTYLGASDAKECVPIVKEIRLVDGTHFLHEQNHPRLQAVFTAELYYKLLCFDWKRITEHRFDQLLNCLPPRKWTRNQEVEYFFMGEAYTEGIHTLAVRCGTDYFACLAPISMLHCETVQRIRKIDVPPLEWIDVLTALDEQKPVFYGAAFYEALVNNGVYYLQKEDRLELLCNKKHNLKDFFIQH